MRRLAALALIAVALPGAALVPGVSWAQALSVTIDQAQRLTISRPAKDVIVGNPALVDVAILDDHHLLLTGKAYGVTNLVVTDPLGREILQRQMIVSAPEQNRVTVYRGAEASSYACAGKCERSGGEPAAGAQNSAAATPTP
ncbi:pilus assembly protein N-terminal domain-containing protein [Caulobacter sp. KR2-114]|uniref:pilus assembly protein N-terminal domain-containing protein n=1 Tax=Caulobacter sp. KR2-114 TaxID=3400912 RepID=UPI003C0DC4BA